ncbi:MAG: DUF3098 domain-containing protein [Bacteroidota bacterium]|jgi:uncharacterized membrane protein
MQRENKDNKIPGSIVAKEGNGIYFDKINYILLIAGIVLIATGYLMMIGGGSEDPNKFNPEIFSKQRITYAPITSIIGFAIIIFAIMRRPKQEVQS